MAINKTTNKEPKAPKEPKAATPAASKAAEPAKENANKNSAVQREEAEELVAIELIGKVQRVHALDRVWEAGTEYHVEASMAARLLSLHDEGKPYFGKYRAKKAAVAVERQPEVVRRPDPVERVSGEGVNESTKRIEVGTPEEEAELFGNVDGQPDRSGEEQEDDKGDGEQDDGIVKIGV